MGKKPKLCAYCGLELSTGPVNREHFVAKCFWGGLPLPNGMKVIRVHESCNSGAKDDAEYLRDILVMTAGTPEHRNAKQAVDVAILNKMDYDVRQFLKMLGEVRRMPVVTSSGLFVGMGEAFRVDTERRNRALHRIIRRIVLRSGRAVLLRATPYSMNWTRRRVWPYWKARKCRSHSAMTCSNTAIGSSTTIRTVSSSTFASTRSTRSDS